jgi:hypothetical protein
MMTRIASTGRSLKARLAATTLAIALAAPAAFAQTPPAKPTAAAPAKPPAAPAPAVAAAKPAKVPSEEARKEARALGDRLNFGVQTQNILVNVRNQIAVAFARGNQKPLDDMIKVVDDVIMPDLNGQSIEITNAIIDAWANTYTLDELKQLRAFYSSPIGDKFIRSQAVLNQEVSAFAQPWAQRIFQHALESHADELKARGIGPIPTAK